MKFNIYWLEPCSPDLSEKEIEQYIKDIDYIVGCDGEYFDCKATFEAKDIEEAKKIANERDFGGQYFEVFKVCNAETGEDLFTEEDVGDNL